MKQEALDNRYVGLMCFVYVRVNNTTITIHLCACPYCDTFLICSVISPLCFSSSFDCSSPSDTALPPTWPDSAKLNSNIERPNQYINNGR